MHRFICWGSAKFFVFSKIMYQWVTTAHCFMSDMPQV
jgi:hypothetical protein